MARTPIIVHVPAQAKEENLPSVRSFYQLLVGALRNHGMEVETPAQRFPPPSPAELTPDRLHITYHTRHSGPNIINAKIGYLPNYFYFDDCGYSGWSMLASRDLAAGISNDDAEAFYASQIAPFIAAGQSKYAQPNIAAQMLAPGYLAIFTQVQGDAVLDLAWHGSRAMVATLLQEARRLGVPAVVKLHPRCGDAGFRAFVTEEARRTGAFLANLNVHQIIAGAGCVAVINSGAGFEALCHRKRVLSFGASDYEAATTAIHSLADAGGAIASGPVDEQAIKRFLFGYLNAQLRVDDADFAAKAVERVLRKMASGKL